MRPTILRNESLLKRCGTCRISSVQGVHISKRFAACELLTQPRKRRRLLCWWNWRLISGKNQPQPTLLACCQASFHTQDRSPCNLKGGLCPSYYALRCEPEMYVRLNFLKKGPSIREGETIVKSLTFEEQSELGNLKCRTGFRWL